MALPIRHLNSADETPAGLGGIDAENVMILAFAGFIGIAILYFARLSGFGLRASLPFAVIVIGLVAAWVLGLRQGKPKNYDIDWFQSFFYAGWNPFELKAPKHPLL